MSILEKLKKNSSIKETAILSKSKFFNNKDMITTGVPMVNVALSGKLDGGLTPGLTMWAGPSKHFKTAFSLLMAKSYMDKYQDAVLLFYDSEFGTPIKYFETFGIDMDRVLHTPLTDIEQLKFEFIFIVRHVSFHSKMFTCKFIWPDFIIKAQVMLVVFQKLLHLIHKHIVNVFPIRIC